jgi:hypothetical protein
MKIITNPANTQSRRSNPGNPVVDGPAARRKDGPPIGVRARKAPMLIMSNKEYNKKPVTNEFDKIKAELRGVGGLFSESERIQWNTRIDTLMTLNGQFVKPNSLLVARQCKAFSVEIARTVKNKCIEKMRNMINKLPSDVKREAMERCLDRYKKAAAAPDPVAEKTLADAYFSEMTKEPLKGVEQAQRADDFKTVIRPLLDSEDFNPGRWREIFQVDGDMKKLLKINAELKEKIFDGLEYEKPEAAHRMALNLQNAMATAVRDIAAMLRTDKKLAV